MDYYSIDRLEGDFAVLERPDKSFISVPLSELPEGAGEGCLLTLNPDGSYTLEARAAAETKKRLLDIQNQLFDR